MLANGKLLTVYDALDFIDVAGLPILFRVSLHGREDRSSREGGGEEEEGFLMDRIVMLMTSTRPRADTGRMEERRIRFWPGRKG